MKIFFPEDVDPAKTKRQARLLAIGAATAAMVAILSIFIFPHHRALGLYSDAVGTIAIAIYFTFRGLRPILLKQDLGREGVIVYDLFCGLFFLLLGIMFLVTAK